MNRERPRCEARRPEKLPQVADFLRASDRTFGLSRLFDALKDPRPFPEIPVAVVARDIVLGASLGVKSVRHLDQLGRLDGMRRLLGSSRDGVASDSTLERVTAGMACCELVERVHRVSATLRRQELLGVTLGGRRLRIGEIDGTTLGGHLTSVLTEIGAVSAFWDAEPIEKKGKELAASHRILERMPEAFVDLLLEDGLYTNSPFFLACRKKGIAGVVKTEEVGLRIIQDANGLFDAVPKLADVEQVSGIDAKRGRAYHVWAIADLPWMETDMTLKVARVRETHLKGKYQGETFTFFVLSQDPTFSAGDLRELGHLRWDIENRGFKQANDQAETKHLFSHNVKTALNFSLLQMIGIMLVKAYRVFLSTLKEQMKGLWDHGSLALRTIRTYFLTSLFQTESNTS